MACNTSIDTSFIHTHIPQDLTSLLFYLYEKYHQKADKFDKQLSMRIVNFSPPLSYSTTELIPDDILKLLHLSKDIMVKNGFNFDDDLQDFTQPLSVFEWLVEFHHYYVNNKTTSLLGRHKDDYGGVSVEVNTIIFYIDKDIDIIDGDLITYESESDKIGNIHKIKKNDMIIMKGDLEHSIQEMDGIGERKSIVVQIQRHK